MMEIFLSQLWVQRLGWTLLHFLWQGTAIAIVYAILRSLLARRLSAQGHYLLACLSLTAMTIAPPLTFLLIERAGQLSASPVVISWRVSPVTWQRLLPSFVAFWLAGVLVFSIRLFGGWRFTARLRATSHPAPPDWQQALERIATQIGSTRPVRLLVSSLVDVPTVVGWLRPVILVPLESLTGLPFDHITALLAHELAHIRRHDYLASLLQSIAEAVLFYHPAVWWISEQIRTERELCCDDLAVAASGDVITYLRALARLESLQPRQAPPKPALAANGGSLVHRIRRLIEPAQPATGNFPGAGAAWAMILLWLAGIGVATIHAAQTTPAPAPAYSRQDPAAALASHTRDAVLFDPFLDTQLAQAQPASSGNTPGAATLSSTLSGRIVQDDNTAPLASVDVRLSKIGQPRLVADLDTDLSGSFTVSDLAPGDYSLVLSKPNFIGVTLAFKIASDTEKIAQQFRLIRSAAISGQVTDSSGHALAGGFVYAMPKPADGDSFRPMPQTTNGPRALVPLDPTGRYRLYNLPPGQYAVALAWGQTRQRAAQSGSSSPLAGLGTGLQLYPSNSAPALFTISGGEQLQANFIVGSAQTYTISGKVDRELKPDEGRYWLGLVVPEQPGLALASAQTEASGTFTFEGIPAGSYDLLVSGPSRGYGGGGGILEPVAQYARMRVVVSGQNVTGLVVSPAPGRSASFVLKRTDNTCPDSAALSMTSLEDWTTVLNVKQTVTSKPQTVENLAPGRYVVSADVPDSVCYATPKTVVIGEENGAIEIVVSPTGAIRGTIGAMKGASPNAQFLAVLSDPESPSGSVRVVHPDATGAFSFTALPPGRYRLAAVPANETSQIRWIGADTRATNVTVTGGATASLDLDAPAPTK